MNKRKEIPVKTKIFQKFEAKIYLIVWILAVLYAIYHFSVISRKFFQHYDDLYNDFSPGWFLLSSYKRDKADFEWETIIYFITSIYPIIVFYSAISEAMKHLQLKFKHIQYFQTLFPIVYLTYRLGYKITLTTLYQPVIFSYAGKFNSTLLIWTCNFVSLGLIAVFKQMNTSELFLNGLGINHFEAYMSILILCWMNLKCTSFYLNASAKTGILDFLCYCYYFPTVFTGPFIPYEDFKSTYNTKTMENFYARIKRLGKNISRCFFWFIFVNIALHFIYVNATAFQIELLQGLDLCTLCGYGYLMGQFFHIKYIVLYGLSTSLASFDNILVPALPRCIGRIHLYSDMWKYFDPGLYNFLKLCIYIPSQNLGFNKIVSSFFCFFFVYIWHGIEPYIFIWSALNFLGVTLENIFHHIYEAKLKHSKIVKNVNEADLRRITCSLAAPLLAMSAISNFYFFAGKAVGDIFLDKGISESSANQLILLLLLYCCCNVSTEMRNVSSHKT